MLSAKNSLCQVLDTLHVPKGFEGFCLSSLSSPEPEAITYLGRHPTGEEGEGRERPGALGSFSLGQFFRTLELHLILAAEGIAKLGDGSGWVESTAVT